MNRYKQTFLQCFALFSLGIEFDVKKSVRIISLIAFNYRINKPINKGCYVQCPLKTLSAFSDKGEIEHFFEIILHNKRSKRYNIDWSVKVDYFFKVRHNSSGCRGSCLSTHSFSLLFVKSYTFFSYFPLPSPLFRT